MALVPVERRFFAVFCGLSLSLGGRGSFYSCSAALYILLITVVVTPFRAIGIPSARWHAH
ncbi:hypothetical protein B0H14DRAFT_2865572 [Mycena olivaceomarginata]|nr:hypothetical protein B0H14DRAFT_2865572 [Mycena olivaceomarginata]